MALKPDRIEMHHDIRWYANATAEAGGVICVSTAGSGGYPGNASSVAAYVANPSGAKVLGVLMYDVVDYDTNRQHENWEKSGFESRKGQKTLICKDGTEVTTNMIVSGVSPAGGDTAYLGANGLLTNVYTSGVPKVGQFQTSKDSDGYAYFRFNLS